MRPEVVLMDEPCSSLDPKSTMRIEELINDLKEEYTILTVTHNMQQAARISDYTAFFYEGHLVEYDTTHKIFNHPRGKEDGGLYQGPVWLGIIVMIVIVAISTNWPILPEGIE